MIIIPKEVKLRKDRYYFECCAGLGDTLLTCGYLYALEKKYNAPITLVVKPSHAFIPKMYNLQDVMVIGLDITIDFIEKNTRKIPQKGKIYAAHPCKHPELFEFFKPVYYYTATFRFLTWFKKFLGLNENTNLKYPICFPSLSKNVEQQCMRWGPFDKIILLSPEATSVVAIPNFFWKELVEKFRRQGFVVISNVVNPRHTIEGSKYVKLSSSDAVALAMKCHSVYSIRSGLCDIIFQKGNKLHVYYPSHTTFFLYELNCMFPNYGIDEQIVLNSINVNNERIKDDK